MDDLDSLMMGGNPQEQERRAKTLKEMQRRANDRIRVYNPTDEDFKVAWDTTGSGGVWTVPARTKDRGRGLGQEVLPRYVAISYVKHMTDKILGERMVNAVRAEDQRRIANGMRPMEIYGNTPESREVFEKKFKTDDMDSRAKILKILWVGIEEEYVSELASNNGEAKIEERSVDEQILDTLERTAQPITEFPELDLGDNLSVAPRIIAQEASQNKETTNTPDLDTLASKDVFTLRKMARERGIDAPKTSTKQDLLKLLNE